MMVATEYGTIRKASEALLKEKQRYVEAVENEVAKVERELEENKARLPDLQDEIASLERLVETAQEVDPDFDPPSPGSGGSGAGGRAAGTGSSAPPRIKGRGARSPAKPKARPAGRPRADVAARNELKEQALAYIREHPGLNGRAIAEGIGLGNDHAAEVKISSILRELQADKIHSGEGAGRGKAWFVNEESRSNGIETPPAPPSVPPGPLNPEQRKVLDAVLHGSGGPAKTPAQVANLADLPLVKVGPILEALTAQGYLQRGRPDSGPAVYAPGKRAAQ